MKNKKFLLFLSVNIFLAFTILSSANAQINMGTNPDFDFSGSGIKIIIVSPPGVFTLPKSQTNITSVCTLGGALNIVLDVVGKNKIEFQDSIVDMCSDETIENLDQHFQMDKVGEVVVDSDSLPYLKDKSALITMRDLPFQEEPDIEVDGELADNQDVENKSWDQSSKTLTFEAKHFTTYRAVAKSSASTPTVEEKDVTQEKKETTKEIEQNEEPADTESFGEAKKEKQIEEEQTSSNRKFLILTVFMAVGVIGYLIWRKKQSL